MSNLIIADDEYDANGQIYHNFATILNEYLEKYVQIIVDIHTESILEGKTANRYLEMAEYCRSSLCAQLPDSTETHRKDMDDLVNRIDQADGSLY